MLLTGQKNVVRSRSIPPRNGRSGSPYYGALRIALDSALALVLLIATAPVTLLAMLLVRLTSPGPSLYSQKRLGYRGRIITVSKIRTMYQHSEQDTGPIWSYRGDPRVTRVGRFLRKSHLDELPQLFSVLRGEMSLIGPRPERPEIVVQLEHALPDYRLRLAVRPGLTGLAQVLQSPDTDLESVRRKLGYDLYYLNRSSAWLDLRILLATPLHLVDVPAGRIARIFGFPDEGQAPSDELFRTETWIHTRSNAEPAYLNSRALLEV